MLSAKSTNFARLIRDLIRFSDKEFYMPKFSLILIYFKLSEISNCLLSLKNKYALC